MSKGFSLIEMMVVVAIIAILAGIAVPAYQNYLVRARVIEALTSIGAHKVTVAENIGTSAALDPRACNNVGSSGSATVNVTSIECSSDGVLTVKTSKVAGSVTLSLTPEVTADNLIRWKCRLEEGLERYVPSECRG